MTRKGHIKGAFLYLPRNISGKLLGCAILFCCLAVCAGCTLGEIRAQSKTIGNVGTLGGKVANSSGRKGPIIVYLFTENKGVFVLESKEPSSESGDYLFVVSPGTHYIAAFVDTNNDGVLQQDEPWNYYGKPTGTPIAAGQSVTLDPLTITDVPPVLPEGIRVESQLKSAIANIGRVVSLDDPMFKRENYSLGMWRPLDFLAQVGGGLLFLQDYEQDKIPVLLVHGVNGGPDDLKEMIGSLDRKRFQPWVLYYPSGARLNPISDYLVNAVADVQNRYGAGKFIVVAHSMGGLVTRSFVKKYLEQYPQRLDNILLVMTINSPMGGMPSAAYGLDFSPVMLQCWRDVAPESEFLKEIHTWTWPNSVPYYLVFSYESDQGNDGVVGLQSQIPLKLQQEATRVTGFNSSHDGILKDGSFLRLFNGILATVK